MAVRFYCVTLRIGQENLFWNPKIQNWQNFLQIPWNLDWRCLIKYHAQPKRLQPRFGADHAFCTSSVPSWCIQFNGAIIVVFIWWISVRHGVAMCMTSVCFIGWKWEMNTWCLCFQVPNMPKGNEGLWEIWNSGYNGVRERVWFNQVKFAMWGQSLDCVLGMWSLGI